MKRIRIKNYSHKRDNDGSIVQLCTCGGARVVLLAKIYVCLFLKRMADFIHMSANETNCLVKRQPQFLTYIFCLVIC